ncbi:MAG: KamA family radical SAM protein [Planctomycetes bacterium]|nr:KamA family radical SAM protein [Planctomycetota bacterium]
MERTLVPPVVATRRSGRAHYYPDVTDAQWADWKWQFRHRLTKLEELEKFLPIPAAERALRADVLRDFRMGITPYYLSLVDADDPADPILRQVAPIAEEYLFRDVGEEDPLGEERYSPVPGITHRYPDRVLMVISNSCAIYCRYCTRKRIMYEDAVPDVEIDRMVEYIAKTPRVRDVIVSGGDPLTYGTKKLESILSKLRAIPHLEIIRIGSRVPVSLPQRIDDELCEMLAKYHPLWINVHFNHPRELTPDAAAACDKLSRAGIPLNNQSVLLKGVNDDVPTMRALCTGLMKMRVRPYYLYQCDQIRGAEHFRTPVSKGIEVIEGLRGHISGLAVPTFVIDAPGGGGKVPVMPQYLLQHDTKNQRVVLRNFQDRLFVYHEPSGRARPIGERSGELEVPAVASPIVESAAPAANAPAPTAVERANGAAPAKASSGTSNGKTNGNGKSNGRSRAADQRVGADGKPVVGKSRWVHRGHSREERVRKANET